MRITIRSWSGADQVAGEQEIGGSNCRRKQTGRGASRLVSGSTGRRGGVEMSGRGVVVYDVAKAKEC